MSDNRFFDTNVLVYAYDNGEPEKQARAQNLLLREIENDRAVISAQVLSEFVVTVSGKIARPIGFEKVEEILSRLAILPVVDIDRSLVFKALEAVKACGVSYWDALIVAAAERAFCDTLYSEDLNPGQTYFGVRVVNPFV